VTGTTTAAADVVAIGETMVALVPQDGGPLTDAAGLAVHVGGAESNVAAYLAALGHRASWVSRLGDDPFGDLVLRRLTAAGVDTTAVERVPGGRTGLYLKDPGAAGTTVHYYRDGSPARALSPDLLRHPAVTGARVLHLSGITAALSGTALDLVRTAVRTPRPPGRTLSFDVNHRAKLWPAQTAAPVLAELAGAADTVFVGLDEAAALWGCATPQDVRDLLPGAGTVVVKDGAVGAHALGARGTVFVPAPRVAVVEPVGAGDAFAAGYLAGLLDGADERTRLRYGHLVAATALGTAGDHTAPPPGDLLRTHLALPDAVWAALDLTGPSR
jgi:2-dehydro-3-deoxygluconokinase